MSSENILTNTPHLIVIDAFDFFNNEFDFLKTLLIVDKQVYDLYRFNNLRINYFIVESIESNKTIKTVTDIIDKLIELQFDKSSKLVGVGGGIVCDITGFVASIYKRGIKHSLIPTTLLSMVDASVGGKTAFNHQNIKNLIGTYKFPEKVSISFDFLKTLEFSELVNGFMEVIKIFITCSNEHFKLLQSVINWNRENISNPLLIESAIKLKCDIVLKDKYDHNIRKILNFGHTFGHAIESVYGFKHGIAVAFGIIIVTYLSFKLQFLDYSIFLEIKELFEKFNIESEQKFDLDKLISFIIHDKKANNGKIEFILLKSIGEPIFVHLDTNELKELVNDLPQFR